jgi:hypothetical protein
VRCLGWAPRTDQENTPSWCRYRYPFVVTTLKAHDPEGGEPAGDDDGAVDEDELSAWPSRRK